MLSRSTLRRLALLPLLLLPGAGCDPKDGSLADSGGTGGTGGSGGSGSTDAETFQQQAILTFESANGVVAGVDEIARGDFSQVLTDLGFPTAPARAADEFQWDPQAGAWWLETWGTETDETGTAEYYVWVWIQFRDGAGTPQMEPDATTEALTIEMDWDIALDAEDNGERIAMDLSYASDLDVSGLPDGPYPVDGTGTMSGRLQWTAPDGNIDVSFAMGWDMALVVPDNDGCPTGEMSVWVDQYRATATYDGTATYSWVMTEDGRQVASGTGALVCGAPPAGTAPVKVWDRWSVLRP